MSKKPDHVIGTEGHKHSDGEPPEMHPVTAVLKGFGVTNDCEAMIITAYDHPDAPSERVIHLFASALRAVIKEGTTSTNLAALESAANLFFAPLEDKAAKTQQVLVSAVHCRSALKIPAHKPERGYTIPEGGERNYLGEAQALINRQKKRPPKEPFSVFNR